MKVVFETETLIEDLGFGSSVVYLYSKILGAFLKIDLKGYLWQNVSTLEVTKGNVLDETRSIGKEFRTVSGENTRDYGDFEAKVVEVDIVKPVYSGMIVNVPKKNIKREFAKEIISKLEEIKQIDKEAKVILKKDWEEDKILDIEKIHLFKFSKYPEWELGIKYEDPNIPQRYKKNNPFTFECLDWLLERYKEHIK